MNQEGKEDSLFVLAEYGFPAVGARGIVSLSVGGNNRVDVTEVNNNPKLLSGRTSNLRLEDMADILLQWIVIDDDNNPLPYNVPRHSDTTSGTSNWRR